MQLTGPSVAALPQDPAAERQSLDGQNMSMRDLKRLHDLSGWHEAVLKSEKCGCFCCLAVFSPNEIEGWIDESPGCPRGPGRTALCPACGIDAVLPDGPDVQLDGEFLKEMQAETF